LPLTIPGLRGFLKLTTLVEVIRDDGVLDEKFEGDDLKGIFVGGFEEDGAGCSCLLDLKPASGADAPSIAGLKSGKAVLRHRGGEVVAKGFAGGEKVGIDDAADGVDTEVAGAGVAAAVAIEARHGSASASGKRLAEDVSAGKFLWFDGGHDLYCRT